MIRKSLAILACLGACAQVDMPEVPEGTLLFADNCAACHGADAKGAGPEMFGIGRVPPDLTTISARNGGDFPRASVLSTVDGYRLGTAPGRAMPEFGEVLGGSLVPVPIDGVLTPTPRALAALLGFLEDVQVP